MQLLGSGAILREAMAAADLLARTSACRPMSGASPATPSCGARARNANAGAACIRCRTRGAAMPKPAWPRPGAGGGGDRLHEDGRRADPPFTAGGATSRWAPTASAARTRQALRAFFEVDRHHIALAALKALADDGVVPRELAADAIQRYGIDPEAVSAACPDGYGGPQARRASSAQTPAADSSAPPPRLKPRCAARPAGGAPGRRTARRRRRSGRRRSRRWPTGSTSGAPCRRPGR